MNNSVLETGALVECVVKYQTYRNTIQVLLLKQSLKSLLFCRYQENRDHTCLPTHCSSNLPFEIGSLTSATRTAVKF